MTLDGYSKNELIHIVEMYNIGLDMDTLRKSKAELLKEMKKVPKKKYVDLPDKPTVKDMVAKDKAKKSSLINKVIFKKKDTKAKKKVVIKKK